MQRYWPVSNVQSILSHLMCKKKFDCNWKIPMNNEKDFHLNVRDFLFRLCSVVRCESCESIHWVVSNQFTWSPIMSVYKVSLSIELCFIFFLLSLLFRVDVWNNKLNINSCTTRRNKFSKWFLTLLIAFNCFFFRFALSRVIWPHRQSASYVELDVVATRWLVIFGAWK